jgi:hypothetical protein
MSPSAWDEYQRLQRWVSHCHVDDTARTHEEQQDEFLMKYGWSAAPFDLYDCRRWQKNLARNRARKQRQRHEALRGEAPWLVRPATPDPSEAAARKDQLTWVKARVSIEEWRMLWVGVWLLLTTTRSLANSACQLAL